MTIERKEIWAGLTTFFTMAYIVVVNPSIMSANGTGITFSGALTSTVLLSFLMTLLMGVYAKLPFAVAPAMGVNALITYTIILGRGIAWPIAFGIVFWAGIFFLFVSATPLRAELVKAIPENLRTAAAVGIGLLLTLIGFQSAGIVEKDPVTILKFGAPNLKMLLSLIGTFFSLFLLRKKSPFAFLATILFITLVSVLTGLTGLPKKLFATPDFSSTLFKLDILGALNLSLFPSILAILFTDLFDSISTFVGVSKATGLISRSGEPLRLKEGLIVDAVATTTAGLFCTASGTAYIESAAGIEVGGKTGKTAIVTALCFLPCLFIAPLAQMVPAFATAPVLILIGSMMFKNVRELEFQKLEDLVPAFLTITIIPLTFSITKGMLVGFIAHVICYLMVGQHKKIRPMMYGVSILSAILLWIDQ
ncbi:MAG: NCS2 family permease [Bacteriovoracia bacterium]